MKSNGKHLLDVGCGPGFFLKLGKELGWNVLGIDPSPKIAEQARSLDLNIITGDFNEIKISDSEKFDVIHMQGVMEHLPEPMKTMKKCIKLLKPGGIFYNVVANDHNPIQQILKKKDFLQFYLKNS